MFGRPPTPASWRLLSLLAMTALLLHVAVLALAFGRGCALDRLLGPAPQRIDVPPEEHSGDGADSRGGRFAPHRGRF